MLVADEDVRSTKKVIEDLFSGIAEDVHQDQLESLAVRDIMETSFVVVHPETDIRELLNIFLNEGIHQAPVVHGNKTVGVVNTWNVWKRLEQYCMEQGPDMTQDAFQDVVKTCAQATVQDVMENTTSINLEKTLLDALILMDEQGLEILPVEKDGELIGLIRDEDIIQVFLQSLVAD